MTRLWPAGRLLKHFESHGMKWRRMSVPDKSLGIYLNPGRGSTDRRLVSRDEGPSTAAMQDRLQAINSFLATQCISIDLPDAAFTSVMGLKYACFDEDNNQALPGYMSKSGRPAMSMQNVYLHRVFAQGSLSKGGRFYGGWWQQIPSKLRRRILINEDKTIECDFSGLACSILYAQLGTSPPNDVYDIGLNYVPNDPRRLLVKKYMNAVLNDSTRKFRLSHHELKRIGLSHDELHKRLTKLHAPIAHHFNSGVGVDLQFVDSEMAEEVMLRLMNQGEVCLPIHDSFIVRVQAAVLLWKTMEGVFIEKFGHKPGIKPEAGYKGHSMGGPRKEILFDAGLSLFEKFTKHLNEYSIVQDFHQSWERTILSAEESRLVYRAMNQEHAHMKDWGLPSIHRHKFWGLPDLLMRP